VVVGAGGHTRDQIQLLADTSGRSTASRHLRAGESGDIAQKTQAQLHLAVLQFDV